jgi:hypothetical protein
MIIKSTLGFSRCPISTAKRVHPHPGWLVSALVAGLSIAGLIGGCGDSDLPPGLTKKTVSIDEVPGKLRAAAKKAIPNVEFKEAWQSLDGQGKLHSYEIRGQQASDGKIREVRVSLAGEILESE